ncbi:MAG: hypothetical protein ACI93H_001818, partial [Psychromonas sp.]
MITKRHYKTYSSEFKIKTGGAADLCSVFLQQFVRALYKAEPASYHYCASVGSVLRCVHPLHRITMLFFPCIIYNNVI